MPENAALELINQQDWLQPIEETLQQALQAAFKPDTAHGRPVENALHGVWLGHPLHPVLTDIPLGAWTVAFILDLKEEFTETRAYASGADASVKIGLLGAAGAAITGLTDWKDVYGKPRRRGLVHGLLNLTATTLYLTSAIQRSRGKRGWGRGLAYAGFGVVVASAWIGGNLVYADRLGVEHASDAEQPEDFVPVLPAAELEEGKPRRAQHGDYPLVLVKKGEAIYALAEICTHMGGPLAQGAVEGDCIRCPWHGSVFRLDNGAVVESPATQPQAAFEARVREGQIEVRLRR
jgi:nitrite reductase/ring-hydroxylating ferredoxin subunit/uncharacterized membrane protein